jgi:hypothetical protein
MTSRLFQLVCERSRGLRLATLALALATAALPARGEAMLELFNLSWNDLARRMPEIAEAGYTSLWLPNPGKGASGTYSVGYDLFDPFDLGDKQQAGTIPTRYGTKADLLAMMEVAHRFGIRVYFDNVMNHRAFTVPGYNAGTPTNFYPGLCPQDFHLQTVGNYFANWPSISNWGNQWEVQYQSLGGLIDLANEPGSINGNFGNSLGSTVTKPVFIRQPTHPEYYTDPTKPYIQGSMWRPFNGTNGQPSAEDVNAYLIRAVLWELNETKCDGFRLDAVKHVPSAFFGDSTSTFNGYCGAIQAMFDYVHGYGTNVLGNGYFESDDSRNSLFDTEAPRNDAMIFGEHLGQPPTYGEYITRGMRLLNAPLRDQMNSALGGNASLQGMDQRDYLPYGGTAFSAVQSVMFAQSQDASGCCATRRDLQNAYYFMHEGLPEIYSDGYNQSGPPNYFPNPPYANYLGEFNDNGMPDICYVHHQLARGGTRPRWSDYNLVAFERYDYREGGADQDQTTVLFVMNDKTSYPGDITFDDGVGQIYDGYYGGQPISNSRNVGLVVGFPPGSVLSQLASSSPTAGRAYQKLLVHAATTNLVAAQADSSRTNTDPTQRLIYVGGQTLAPGGGAIELNVPTGSWVMYGYQWPEASRANVATNAISFRQGGRDVPRMVVQRTDGLNGDTNYNPLFPFKMRGSVDAAGNVIPGTTLGNRSYSIDIPVVTNANFDIIVRSDASAVNSLVKLDGGVDINSQMGLGPTNGGVGPNGPDLRDNRPGYATDVFLGYEQTALVSRYGAEKFASTNIGNNNVTSLGAETYYYAPGGASAIVAGSGNGANRTNSTANWVYHQPIDSVTLQGGGGPASQRNPLNPGTNQAVDLWVKVGYQFQIDKCFIYYTTDGSNPEGAFGVGLGTTRTIEASWVNHDSVNSTIDWWRGTIPGSNQVSGVQIRYKIALFKGGYSPISPVTDADDSKLYGLDVAAITNFNPTTATVWLHNDLNTNSTITGLREGYHIVRARTFLPRSGKASVFNTILQTFYYDAQAPTGAVAYPTTDGNSISNNTYTLVVRADSAVTGVEVNIADSDPNNDDAVTGQNNGNGLSNGVPKFAAATGVTPDATLSQQYPNLPLEYRFNYVGVPNSGTATLTVHLKKVTSGVLSNRVTTLTRVVNTFAPAAVVQITSPATDGSILVLATNDIFTLQTCFTSFLSNDVNSFSLYINGVFQPRAGYILRPTGCAAGLRTLYYNWTGSLPGTNFIQVLYSNLYVLGDTRLVAVARPGDSDGDGMSDYQELIAGTDPFDSNSVLRITGLANDNQLVVWDSVSNRNYQVLATTNLSYPLIPISPVIPGAGSSTFYFDDSPAAAAKYYRVQVVP